MQKFPLKKHIQVKPPQVKPPQKKATAKWIKKIAGFYFRKCSKSGRTKTQDTPPIFRWITPHC